MDIIGAGEGILKGNQFLSGALGAGAVGYILVQARNIPARIGGFILDQFTISLTINNEDDFSYLMHYWLSNHPNIKRSRKLTINDSVPFSDRENILTAGPGRHLLWDGLRPVFLNKTSHENDRGGRTITLHFRTVGRSQEPFKDIIYKAIDINQKSDKVSVYFFNSSAYDRSTKLSPRPLDSIFMDENIKKDLVEDAKNFCANHKWYQDRGLPYRRGYMLYGPPGTGKSSLIFSLAAALGRSLYVVNPSGISSDEALARAFDVNEDSIVVIEDIDAVEISQTRVPAEVVPGEILTSISSGSGRRAAYRTQQALKGGSITLSGLLNAIDGVGASEGRILIVTTNHPEDLDPALLRSGRIDRKFHLDALSSDLALAMCKKFLGDNSGEVFYNSHIAQAVPIIPAELQNLLLMELASKEE